tara:strand:- start:135 stop:614 length:480 start_codon:yes stop_codon:yes gene_type:complete
MKLTRKTISQLLDGLFPQWNKYPDRYILGAIFLIWITEGPLGYLDKITVHSNVPRYSPQKAAEICLETVNAALKGKGSASAYVSRAKSKGPVIESGCIYDQWDRRARRFDGKFHGYIVFKNQYKGGKEEKWFISSFAVDRPWWGGRPTAPILYDGMKIK